MAHVARGDQVALQTLTARHTRRALMLTERVRGIVGGNAGADDVRQEAFYGFGGMLTV